MIHVLTGFLWLLCRGEESREVGEQERRQSDRGRNSDKRWWWFCPGSKQERWWEVVGFRDIFWRRSLKDLLIAQKEGVSRVKKWFQNSIGLNDWKDGVALNCNRADHEKKSLGKIIAYLYAFENDSVENENTVEGEMKNWRNEELLESVP